MIDNITQPLIVTHTMPSRLYASDGTTLKQLNFRYSAYQEIRDNGDKMFAYFTCKGNETKLYIRSFKDSNSGIWDLYVNGVLDSSGYDSYAAAGVSVSLEIILTEPIIKGLNIIEFRVNGKNASSTGYKITISSMLVQW